MKKYFLYLLTAINCTAGGGSIGGGGSVTIVITTNADIQVNAYSNKYTPNSIFTGNASDITNINASSLVAGTVPDAQLAANVVRTNNAGVIKFTNTANSFNGTINGTLIGNFTGSISNGTDGSGLTNLNASKLATGTVPDLRLSTNVLVAVAQGINLPTDFTFGNTGWMWEVFAPTTVGFAAGASKTYQVWLDNVGNFTIDGGGAFTGNGSNIVNLNASALAAGTVPDARLGSNIVRFTESYTIIPNTNTIILSSAPIGISNGAFVWNGTGAWTNHDAGIYLNISSVEAEITNSAHNGSDGVAYSANLNPASINWLSWNENPLPMQTIFITNTITTNFIQLAGPITGTFAGDGSGLTNLPHNLSITNGVWLEHAGIQNYYGSNGFAFLQANLNAINGDTIWLKGNCILNLDGSVCHISKSVNIKGTGPGVWDYGLMQFFGGPIFTNGGLQYDTTCTNFWWDGFSIEHFNTVGLTGNGSAGSTAIVNGHISNVRVGCVSTNGITSSEGAYITSSGMEVDELEVYCEPQHGLVIKSIANSTFTRCKVFDWPSASYPFEAVVIKADPNAGSDAVRNVKITDLSIVGAHGQGDLLVQCNYAGVLTNLVIDGLYIEDNGSTQFAPIPAGVNFEFYHPTNVWKNVVVKNVHIKSDGTHMWNFYQPSLTDLVLGFTNTTLVNWTADMPNCVYPGNPQASASIAFNGGIYINNIQVGATNWHGIDTNLYPVFVGYPAFTGNGNGLTNINTTYTTNTTYTIAPSGLDAALLLFAVQTNTVITTRTP